jgi:hypothetical protein
MTEDMKKIVEKLMKDAMTKEFWIEGMEKSFACLITCEESLGEYIYLKLLNESVALPALLLACQLRQLADALEQTEYSYLNQCGGLKRTADGRPDLAEKPEGYKPRVEFFLEEVKKKDTDPLGCEAEFVVREGWVPVDTGSPFLWRKRLKFPWEKRPD